MKFQQKLRMKRTERKMSQEELAVKVGTSKSAISFWENGLRSPKIEQVMKIANVFGIDWVELMDDDRMGSFAPMTMNQEQSLIDAYRNLNEEGKRMLLTFAQSLVYNPLYGNGEGSMKDAFLYDGAKNQKALEDLTENEKAALANRPPTKEKK